MFGYIKPVQGELLVKENEFYKAVYCGLCREGGKRISRLTRFFLNNDFVFLCIVRMAVNGEKICAANKRCPYAFKKKCMICENESLIYTCAAFGLLIYYKALDDFRDSHGIGKLLSRMRLWFVSSMKKRASALYPELEESVSSSLARLSGLEKSGCSSPDIAADCFAEVTRIVASGGAEGENKRILGECGYHIGRYVYLIDAFADSSDDFRDGEYNVFNLYYSSPEAVLEAAEAVRVTLNDSIMAFCRAYELTGGTDYDRLIYNTAQLGSAQAYETALKSLGEQKSKNDRNI